MKTSDDCPECGLLLGSKFPECRTCTDYMENLGVPWSKLFPKYEHFCRKCGKTYSEITLCCGNYTISDIPITPST